MEGAGRRLSRAAARRDHPPLHGRAAFWPDNPHYLSAIERGDVIYTSAIVQQVLHALIQVVFALNREYFPGEKKLADALEKLTNRAVRVAITDRFVVAGYPANADELPE